jgi:NitT/TauT family transport system ATP-binding protein
MAWLDRKSVAGENSPAIAANSALLSVENVTLHYKTREHLVVAAEAVNFSVGAAERFVLLGPSGCGKSTLLKAIAGFIPPVAGAIRLNGRPVREPGPDRIMVFQEFDQLLPWKTVKDNIVFPLIVTGQMSACEAEERARHYIDKVKLTGFAELYPHMLSGGMKQRAALARALALQPAILLMDEPFAALDALTRRKMQDELLALWNDVRFTVIFVTHSIEEAILIGSRILVLSPHPGRVRAEFDAAAFGHTDRGEAGFAALQQEIHDLLFSEPLENAVA